MVKWLLEELTRVYYETAVLPMLLGLTFEWSCASFWVSTPRPNPEVNPDHKCSTLLEPLRMVKWLLEELA